jgi:transposase
MKAIGVDVAKHSLHICVHGIVSVVENKKREIARFLRDLPREYAVGVESTNSYWFKLASTAHEMGFVVYVLDAGKLRSYRESIPGRGKTDKRDAEVIARYVEREHDKLRRYTPIPERLRGLLSLFRRRMKVVRAKVALSASLSDVPELAKERKRILACLESAITHMDAAIEVRAALLPGYRELMEVTCLGPVAVAGLLTCFERAEFPTADQLISFVGLDPRPNQSGEREGPRKLKIGRAHV